MLIYVISLKEPKEKIEYLQTFGLQPRWIEGVNGQALDRKAIRENVSSYFQYLCPKSAIGCALSHFKAWNEFLQTNEKYAVVFEDDVVLENFFIDRLYNALNHVPDNYDILYLGCFGCDSENVSNVYKISGVLYGKNKRKGQINQYISIPEYAYATHAYVISREGAKKILYFLEGKIYDHIDLMLQQLSSSNRINTYVTTPRLAFQTSTDSSTSENVKSKHPMLLTKPLRNYEIDTMVRGDYQVTTAAQQIGPYIINIISIFFFLLGVVLSLFNIPISYLSAFYLILSVPDLLHNDRLNNMNAIVFNYLVFIFPSLLRHHLRR